MSDEFWWVMPLVMAVLLPWICVYQFSEWRSCKDTGGAYVRAMDWDGWDCIND